MKVGLLEFPRGTLPNLALMRLSSWHKARGDEVILNPGPLDYPDRVYISVLFTWKRPEAFQSANHFRAFADVRIGGPGMLRRLPDGTWDPGLSLPPAVDAMANDYDLYGVDFGIGYSSRGCIRTCGFCPVPKIEGRPVREAASIADLLNARSRRLVLMDNNFGASPDWRSKLREIRERELHVAWSQGLDIRLIDQEQAAAFGDLRARGQLWNQRFTRSGVLHFAWDNPTPGREIEAGIRRLFDVGFLPSDLTFYVLIGFWWLDEEGVRHEYDVEEELSRLYRLHAFRIRPKVMVYRDESEQDTRDPIRMDIQHWNDGHLWRSVADFSRYRRSMTRGRANQIADTLSLDRENGDGSESRREPVRC